MLFTVNKSPFENGSLKSCLRFAANDTPILLYEDAVYAATPGTSLEKSMKEALKKHEIYVLEPDLKARGVNITIDGIKVIDYSGFVELVESHSVCPWI